MTPAPRRGQVGHHWLSSGTQANDAPLEFDARSAPKPAHVRRAASHSSLPSPAEDHLLALHGALALELRRHYVDGHVLSVSINVLHLHGGGLQGRGNLRGRARGASTDGGSGPRDFGAESSLAFPFIDSINFSFIFLSSSGTGSFGASSNRALPGPETGRLAVTTLPRRPAACSLRCTPAWMATHPALRASVNALSAKAQVAWEAA